MHVQQGVVLETLRGIQRFRDDNVGILGAAIPLGAQKRLDETVTRMSEHAVDQIGGRRVAEGETAKQRSLSGELRYYHMQPIALVASQELREKPEFTLLRLPRYKVRGTRLTTAARDMANAAEKYTQLFVDGGLRSDFVAQLRAAADRLDESLAARGQSQGQRAGATAGLKAETKKARVLIKLLDSLVRPALGTNDALIREWESVSHVRRPRKSSSEQRSSGAETPAVAATPAVTLVS